MMHASETKTVATWTELAERIEHEVRMLAGTQGHTPLFFAAHDACVARIRAALTETETTIHPRVKRY